MNKFMMRGRRILKEGNLKQKYLVLFATFFALLGIILIASLSNKDVVSASMKQNKKLVKSVQIQKGDTLWDIAEENYTDEYENIQEYIDEIMECNSLSSDIIYEGAYLTVPYFASN